MEENRKIINNTGKHVYLNANSNGTPFQSSDSLEGAESIINQLLEENEQKDRETARLLRLLKEKDQLIDNLMRENEAMRSKIGGKEESASLFNTPENLFSKINKKNELVDSNTFSSNFREHQKITGYINKKEDTKKEEAAGSSSPFKKFIFTSEIKNVETDYRLILTPDNSILNNPNASKEDLLLLLNHKATLGHISADPLKIKSIISAVELISSKGTTCEGLMYTLKSIIMLFDQKIHACPRTGNSLCSYLTYFGFSLLKKGYQITAESTKTKDTIIVSHSSDETNVLATFRYGIIDGNRFVYEMMR